MSNSLQNLFSNRIFKIIIISAFYALIITLFGSVITSFIYRYKSTNIYVNDASMFTYMGEMFSKGQTPYVDVFDHKGLYIFYYIALGAIIGKSGILAVQFIIYLIFIYFYFLTLEVLGIKRELVYISLAFLASLLIISSQSPSDFELLYPFITSSLYYYIKGVKGNNQKSFLIGNFLAGLTAGIAINIRASDAMVPLALVIFYFIYVLKNKKIYTLIPNALISFCGLLLTITPPFLHAYFGGFFSLMIDSIIFSNFRYVGSMPQGTFVKITAIVTLVIILIAYGTMLLYSRHKRSFPPNEFLFYLTTFTVLIVFQFAIAYYIHYLYIGLPLLLIQGVAFVNQFSFGNIKKQVFRYLGTGLVVVSCSFNVINYYARQYKVDRAIKTYIDTNIDDEAKNGKVLGLMISASIYLNSNMVAGYADFTCQHNHIRSSATYSLEKLEHYLLSGECRYLITQNDYTPISLLSFVDEKLIDSFTLLNSNEPGASYINIYEFNK